jgi:hypothetical protein
VGDIWAQLAEEGFLMQQEAQPTSSKEGAATTRRGIFAS